MCILLYIIHKYEYTNDMAQTNNTATCSQNKPKQVHVISSATFNQRALFPSSQSLSRHKEINNGGIMRYRLY